MIREKENPGNGNCDTREEAEERTSLSLQAPLLVAPTVWPALELSVVWRGLCRTHVEKKEVRHRDWPRNTVMMRDIVFA